MDYKLVNATSKKISNDVTMYRAQLMDNTNHYIGHRDITRRLFDIIKNNGSSTFNTDTTFHSLITDNNNGGVIKLAVTKHELMNKFINNIQSLLKKYHLDLDMKFVRASRFPVNGEIDAWFENEKSRAHRCITVEDLKSFKSLNN